MPPEAFRFARSGIFSPLTLFASAVSSPSESGSARRTYADAALPSHSTPIAKEPSMFDASAEKSGATSTSLEAAVRKSRQTMPSCPHIERASTSSVNLRKLLRVKPQSFRGSASTSTSMPFVLDLAGSPAEYEALFPASQRMNACEAQTTLIAISCANFNRERLA
eukprot:6213542-Pleurochrysis_carterae.AAC.4